MNRAARPMTEMPESENETLTYDSYASVEVLEEGAKTIGWDQRNPIPGGNPGRFKRGFGVANSQHHAGRVGYREGEVGFERIMAEIALSDGGFGGGGGGGAPFNAELELRDDGNMSTCTSPSQTAGRTTAPRWRPWWRKFWDSRAWITSGRSGATRISRPLLRDGIAVSRPSCKAGP